MSDAVVGIVVTTGCGLLCAGLGAYMIATGNPALLHGYHYATTPLAERPALARESGAGLVAVGAGCVLLGLADHLAAWVAVAGAVLLAGGVAASIASIIRHNGSLVSFVPATGGRLPRSAASWAAGALMGVLLGLLLIVPGAHMAATGDVSMLHSYHYEGIAAGDLPAFSLVEGLAMVALGAGIFLCCVAGGRMAGRPATGWARAVMAAGGALLCAGLLVMLLAIPYFGGSLT